MVIWNAFAVKPQMNFSLAYVQQEYLIYSNCYVYIYEI